MLALAMGDWQIEMFPKATASEFREAKMLLSRYRRMKMILDDFEKVGSVNISEKQATYIEAYKNYTSLIERAVGLIMDDEIRRIIELRYIKGERHKVTVLLFGSIMHPTTVDRKLNRGIECVANTLKLWGL
jgi:ribosomal protein S13